MLCGEGAATERRTTNDRHPERLNRPDSLEEDLEEGGEHGQHWSINLCPDTLRLASTAANADMDASEAKPLGVDTHERGGALPVVGAVPAPAEGTAGIELAGGAEIATTAKPEALGHMAGQGMDGKHHRKEASANLRHCHKGARKERPGGCMRRCHQSASANAAQRCKAARASTCQSY